MRRVVVVILLVFAALLAVFSSFSTGAEPPTPATPGATKDHLQPTYLTSAEVPGHLRSLPEFTQACKSILPAAESWGGDGGALAVNLPHEKFDVEGPICLRGRKVLRLQRAPNQSLKPRPWKGWWTTVQITPIQYDEVERRVVRDGAALHGSLLMLVAPAYQMFHAWFDGAVPAASFLLRYNGGSLLAAPRDVVSMYVDGKPRSKGAENATLMVLRELGRSARQLLPEDDAINDLRFDCYCGAVLLGSNFFSNVDVRQEATAFVAKLLYERFGLPPHGTSPGAVWHQMSVTGRGGDYAALWRSACNSTTANAPRLLLLLRRHTRRMGQSKEIAQLAREAGFCVLVFESESYSTETQLRVARVADMVAGVHGQGLSWMVFMDGQGNVSGCRRVLEFNHFGRQLLRRNDVYVMLAQDVKLRYDRIKPTDVQFGPTVANPHAERRGLMKAVFPYDFKGFYDQTVFFDLNAVKKSFQNHFAELTSCLSRS